MLNYAFWGKKQNNSIDFRYSIRFKTPDYRQQNIK